MNFLIRSASRTTGLLLVALLCSRAPAEEEVNGPRISPDKRPALLLVEAPTADSPLAEKPTEDRPMKKSNLCVAHFEGGKLHKDVLASASYFEVSQLDHAVFLVCLVKVPFFGVVHKGEVYAIDFDPATPKDINSAAVRPLGTHWPIHCLRSLPRRGKAMLAEVDLSKDEVRLLELDFLTLKTRLRHTLTKTQLGYEFREVGPRLRLSPDLKRVAYVSRTTPKKYERFSEYILRVLDLSSGRTEDLDNNVSVQVSPKSHYVFCGVPPLQWISNQEVLYQDMVRSDEDAESALETVCVLKSVNVQTKRISERLRKRLPLTFDGGSLHANPLEEGIVYRDNWVVDLDRGALTARIPSAFRGLRDASISEALILTYRGTGRVDTCISPSGRNFAYFLRTRLTFRSWNSELWAGKLYAKVDGLGEPIQVAQGTYYKYAHHSDLFTRPIAWIEEKSPYLEGLHGKKEASRAKPEQK